MPQIPRITPIGFDAQAGSTPVSAQAPDALPQASTAGLTVLNSSAQQTQNSIEMYGRSEQVRSQAVQQVAQSAVNSVQQITEADSRIATLEAQKAQSFSLSVNAIGDTISRGVKAYADSKAEENRLKQAMLKAQRADNYLQATKSIEEHKLEGARTTIFTEGPKAWQRKGVELISQYDLDPDDARQLVADLANTSVAYQKNFTDKQVKAAEDREKNNFDAAITGNEIKYAAVYGRLASPYSTPEETQKILADITELDAAIFKGLPTTEMLELKARTYKTRLEIMQKRGMNVEAVAAEYDGVVKLNEFASEQQKLVAENKLTASQYEASVYAKSVLLGVKGYTPPGLQADSENLVKSLSLDRKLKELRQADAQDQVAAIGVDSTVQASIGLELTLNKDGSLLRTLEAADPKTLDPNTKAAIASHKEWVKFRDVELQDFLREDAQKATRISNAQASLTEWYTRRAAESVPSPQSQQNYAKMLEGLRMSGVNVEQFASKNPLTQAEVDQMRAALDIQVRAIDTERGVAARRIQLRQQQFAERGFSADESVMRATLKSIQPRLDEYRKRLDDIQAKQYEAPAAFSPGLPSNTPTGKPLHRAQYAGVEMVMPFPQGVTPDSFFEGQGFNASRGNGKRTHNALDFAVPIGTPLTSVVGGKVIDVSEAGGYGQRIIIKGNDGYEYNYAHLSKYGVSVGQVVQPGQVIGLSGNSGVGSGPHLHLDILDSSGNIVDPRVHLSSKSFGAAPRQVRSTGQPQGSMPSGQQRSLEYPRGAIPLGGGMYLFGGKVMKANATRTAPQQTSATYSKASPIRNGELPYSATDASYGVKLQPLDDTHGYEVLRKNPQLTKAINTVGRNLSIPGVWLADLMGFETGYEFRSGYYPTSGRTGLVQFNDLSASDVGTSVSALAGMQPHQQMPYVEKYLRNMMSYSGIKEIRNIGELIAMVNQGPAVVKDVRNRGVAAMQDPRNSDGHTTLQRYLDNLGSRNGRRYPLSRANRLASAVVHTHPTGDCAMCSAMLSSAQMFIPHEGQYSA
jgi:murein DD-endopeptidase MepM/ murein hydrolase activator NlpD